MKITYKINFVCSEDLNSKENIDFEFVKDGTYIPRQGFYIGGKFCALNNSYYEVTTDEAIVYASCFFPRNRVVDVNGGIDPDKAQKVAFNLIAHLADAYNLKGTYTTRK